MSELKSFIVRYNGEFIRAYNETEADKVIAEKDKEIAELKEQVHDYAQGLYVLQARAEKELRHHKYKRCLAMTRRCYDNWIRAYNLNKIDKTRFYVRWKKRWLELAEKFK